METDNGEQLSREELTRRAAEAGMSIEDYLAKLVRDYLDKPDNNPLPPPEPPEEP